MDQLPTTKILILYFSLSGQSRGLINLFAAGLRSQGVSVVIEQIKAQKKITYPFKGVLHTFKMMLTTFIRLRISIDKPSPPCFEPYDLIVLAGPTWSYNPSGPVLSLLDQYGKTLFTDNKVLPIISCRGYYRIHNTLLRKQLKNCGALLEDSIIFSHPVPEPWSTIGVFLKSAGYSPEKIRFMKHRYRHFGHTADQLRQAKALGQQLGSRISTEKD